MYKTLDRIASVSYRDMVLHSMRDHIGGISAVGSNDVKPERLYEELEDLLCAFFAMMDKHL